MPTFGFSVRSLSWPGRTTRHSVDGEEDAPVSRVNKKSPAAATPQPPPPSTMKKTGTTPSCSAAAATTQAEPGSRTGSNRRMNSWGRGGVRAFSSSNNNSKRSFRSGNNHPKNKTTDPRFQDPGTASTLSLPPPSEAEFSMGGSSSFFFRRSPSLVPQQPSTLSSPPSPLAIPLTPELPTMLKRESPLQEKGEGDGGVVDKIAANDNEQQPVDKESLSSSRSTLCPALRPSSPPPLLDGPSSSLTADFCPSSSSYEMTRNDRRELGFMAFDVVTNSSASYDDDADNDLPAEAIVLSRETGKPILQYRLSSTSSSSSSDATAASDMEVALQVWSHPLLVEAAQSLFLTVCVEAPTAKARERFASPSSSLDVLDSAGTKLVPTLVSPPSFSSSSSSLRDDNTNVINRRSVARAMVRALDAHRPSIPVPRYLHLLLEEEEAGQGEVFVVGTDDPVGGEAEFAGLAGVVATRTGSVDQHRQRVVEVTYDPRRLSFGCVARFALKRKVGGIVYHRTNDERMSAQVEIGRLGEVAETKLFAGTIQPDFDPKPALRRTPLRYVPLTSLQASRANRLVHLGRFDEAVHLLSPRQGLILMKTMRTSAHKVPHDVIDVPILPAWISVCDKPQQEDDEEDDPTCDYEPPPSYYEYNRYSVERLPPGYPWRGF